MKITVLGQGYVGLNISVAAASKGFEVIGFDLNSQVVEQLEQGKTFVPGISQPVLLDLIKENLYKPTKDENKISDSEIYIIAVPTPLDSKREPDLSYLITACKTIARNATTDALVINESTSFTGTLRNIIHPIIQDNSNMKFDFAVAPERVDPGNEDFDIFNTPRVISGLSDSAISKTYDFYANICNSIYSVSSPELAESVKLFENTFRLVNISLANEFAIFAEKFGFSANDAIKLAATKPFGFTPFYPSIGIGGHCIPIDPNYLIYIASKHDLDLKLIKTSDFVNLDSIKNIISRIHKILGLDLAKKNIQLVGLSYKANVSDLRESPALRLLSELRLLGANVKWHDQLVQEYNGDKSCPLDSTVDLGIIISSHSGIDYFDWLQCGVKVIDCSPNNENYGWPKFL